MENIANEIRKRLLELGKTVAAAESITAGHLQAALSSVSGASDVFQGGITAYQPEIKIKHLGVDAGLARRTDCVDEEVARQMAVGAIRLFESDYAIATCGYAEPYPDWGIDGPFAYYAIAARTDGYATQILWSDRIELLGLNRTEAQRHTAQVVLEKLLLQLAAAADAEAN